MKSYLFGAPPTQNYNHILDIFSQTDFKSARTSSIPLAQFWKSTQEGLNEVTQKLNITTNPEYLCFEYPTPPDKGRGKASMTDLMILGDGYKISIEAKFTEYQKTSQDTVEEWLKKGGKNREQVLESWKDMIKPFTYNKDFNNIEEIEYQFFHRTASACKDVKKAFVVYQVFYDKETKPFLDDFIKKLNKYKGLINPDPGLEFWLWTVEVEQLESCKKSENPFLTMKKEDVYKIISSELGPM